MGLRPGTGVVDGSLPGVVGGRPEAGGALRAGVPPFGSGPEALVLAVMGPTEEESAHTVLLVGEQDDVFGVRAALAQIAGLGGDGHGGCPFRW
jgi:hypothetical protein